MKDFLLAWHPELAVDGFSANDGTIMFFNFVRSCCLMTKASHVLDYGAGRGMFWYEDVSQYRKSLRDLRATGAHVTACDIDEAVLSHPCSDAQVKIKIGQRLPFDDSSFDVIVSENTFEHIADPEFVASELFRILRPGGYICARTPNRAGYLRLLSGLVPNQLHAKVLLSVQPQRKAEDVFPTVYKMNSPAQVRSLFPQCEVYHAYTMGEPSYYFDNRIMYAAFKLLHWMLPSRLSPAVSFFIHRPV